MAVYGYVRVSTKIQADDGLSLDAQERQIRGYTMMQGMTVDHIYIEKAVSGWKPLVNRAKGQALMSSLMSGDVIVCSKLDRMFRSARDALTVSDELKQRGVKLHLIDLGGDVTGNGVSKMFFTIVAAFAEFERDRIAERISDVKSSEREKGRYLGGTQPFGYRVSDEGGLLECEAEQSAIREMIYLRRGGDSFRAIADKVSSGGIRVSHMTVKKVLES